MTYYEVEMSFCMDEDQLDYFHDWLKKRPAAKKVVQNLNYNVSPGDSQ